MSGIAGLCRLRGRRALTAAIALGLIVPVAAKKKGKFLAAYPGIMKFFMFWWCIAMFAIMGAFVIDFLLTRYLGPARVDWSVEHLFRGAAGREAYWKQLVDPTTWSTKHPVLQSATIRMVKCEVPEGSLSASTPPPKADGAAEGEAAGIKLVPVELGPMKPGMGLMMRHKDGSGPRGGSLFCTRECTKLETPRDEPWHFVWRTVEVGAGYPFMPGTEEIRLEMWPAAEDGSIRCRMTGVAAVSSRFFRWWTKLVPSTKLAAEATLAAIEEEVDSGKKQD